MIEKRQIYINGTHGLPDLLARHCEVIKSSDRGGLRRLISLGGVKDSRCGRDRSPRSLLRAG